ACATSTTRTAAPGASAASPPDPLAHRHRDSRASRPRLARIETATRAHRDRDSPTSSARLAGFDREARHSGREPGGAARAPDGTRCRMTTSGPDGPTKPITTGPDAPTGPTAPREPTTKRIARAVRGVLTDTRPLRTPAYRRLWSAGIVTVIGAQLSVVAVPAQIYELTGSSAYVGLTGLFGLVPLVVFGLWGGAIADAMDRRTLLLLSGAGIALSSLALWVTAASGLGGVWTVLGLFAVQTAFLAVHQPARNAGIPRLLPAD